MQLAHRLTSSSSSAWSDVFDCRRRTRRPPRRRGRSGSGTRRRGSGGADPRRRTTTASRSRPRSAATQHRRPAGDGAVSPRLWSIDPDLARPRPRPGPPGAASTVRSAATRRPRCRSPPTCGLELVGRALGDRTGPWSMTTMSSASWSASSRYWVVSSSVVPRSTRSRIDVPQVEPAPRVETRSWARRGTAPAARRPARRPGRAGGACRPSRS